MKVTVVIPAYKEAVSVAAVVQSVKPYCAEVVVVDDGSLDDTFAQALNAGAVTLRHEVNRGYGAALVTGCDYAFATGADVVVHFDADGQHNPGDVKSIVESLDGQPVAAAIGSRFLGTVIGISRFHRTTLRLAAVFSFAVTGRYLTDPHNGLRAITAAAWRKFTFRQDRMAFASEFIEEVVRAQVPLKEVPTTVRYTQYSRAGSKQGFLPSVKIVKDLLIGKLMK